MKNQEAIGEANSDFNFNLKVAFSAIVAACILLFILIITGH